MSKISEALNAIMDPANIYGKDIRKAIHDGIEVCYDDVTSPALNSEAFKAAVQSKIDDGSIAAMTIREKSLTGDKLADETITKDKLGEDVQAEFSSLKEDLTDTEDRISDYDGIEIYRHGWRQGNISINDKVLNYTHNEYTISLPENNIIYMEYGDIIHLSDYDNYRYRIYYKYNNGTKWYMGLNLLENDYIWEFTNVNSCIVVISRRDNKKIRPDSIPNNLLSIHRKSNIKKDVKLLNELAVLNDQSVSVHHLCDTDMVASIESEAVIVDGDLEMTIDQLQGIFNKKIGGNGTITVKDWPPNYDNPSNIINISILKNYLYKCMHIPHDGGYKNLEYKEPGIPNLLVTNPFKMPIGAIYLDTDKNTELGAIFRIFDFKMYGFRNGIWYELSNLNVKWAAIYNLPWNHGDAITNITVISQSEGSILLDLRSIPLTENTVLHFGTRNVYAKNFDYFVVSYKVKANKDGFGAKIAIDARDSIAGSPTQMMSSRVFSVPYNGYVTVLAHTIPDDLIDRLSIMFNENVPLYVPNAFCGKLNSGDFILNTKTTEKYILKIEDLSNGNYATVYRNEEGDLTINDTNSLLVVNEKISRTEIYANVNFHFLLCITNKEAISNYNADLIMQPLIN